MTNKQLNDAIHSRDGDACIICGKFVDPGEKWHHHPFGIHKKDRIECGCLLCMRCHNEVHFGKNSALFKDKCNKYLSNLYPEYWVN